MKAPLKASCTPASRRPVTRCAFSQRRARQARLHKHPIYELPCFAGDKGTGRPRQGSSSTPHAPSRGRSGAHNAAGLVPRPSRLDRVRKLKPCCTGLGVACEPYKANAGTPRARRVLPSCQCAAAASYIHTYPEPVTLRVLETHLPWPSQAPMQPRDLAPHRPATSLLSQRPTKHCLPFPRQYWKIRARACQCACGVRA